jgi:hypothetical protein
MAPKRKTIGLQPSEYGVLASAKEAHEAQTGQKTDWGEFLLILLGLYIGDLATKKLRSTSSRSREQPVSEMGNRGEELPISERHGLD